MPKRAVCPECFEGMHECCIGPGCYCDCQMPDDGPTAEDLGELEDEDNFLQNGYC